MQGGFIWSLKNPIGVWSFEASLAAGWLPLPPEQRQQGPVSQPPAAGRPAAAAPSPSLTQMLQPSLQPTAQPAQALQQAPQPTAAILSGGPTSGSASGQPPTASPQGIVQPIGTAMIGASQKPTAAAPTVRPAKASTKPPVAVPRSTGGSNAATPLSKVPAALIPHKAPHRAPTRPKPATPMRKPAPKPHPKPVATRTLKPHPRPHATPHPKPHRRPRPKFRPKPHHAKPTAKKGRR